MGDSDTTQQAVRIERGQAGDEEVAALTVVLLALLAREREQGAGASGPGADGWRWKGIRTYQAPSSWQ
ncbi:acyl-CoA carboxylase epsilon subunit [Streptomyces sp. NPDC048275]|uniref:acyl-CoA carboxylase epsilon subunit n=1 Tax=Streptomyces sp. NPDC048275 TaxID=3155629 RepID=UPI0033D35A17